MYFWQTLTSAEFECVRAIPRYLHSVRNLLTVREDLRQVLGAQDVPQGGLSQQPGGGVGVVDVGHGQDGVLHLVVDHAVHADRHRVFGQNLGQRTSEGVVKDALGGAPESARPPQSS